MSRLPSAWRTPRLLATGLLATSLTACAAAGSSPVCPSLVTYSPAVQSQAADELQAMPSGAVVPQMMADYSRLRDQVRACRQEAA